MIQALRGISLAVCLTLPVLMTVTWIGGAHDRLEASELGTKPAADRGPVAAPADEEYCSPGLKRTLRRVLQSCGLLSGGRGCQPLEAKAVATVSGEDFNALFTPMKDRGAIIQYERGEAELDAPDKALIDTIYAARGGASYFFVVGRASADGPLHFNRKLSQKRVQGVLEHLRQSFDDPELEQTVGLLWLGEEFAQLEADFCAWRRSGSEQACTAAEINRSAFVAWIDCRL